MNKSIKSFIENTLHFHVIELFKTDKGLTNQNFYCKCVEGEFMIRWPHKDSTHIVKRHHEAKAIEIVKDLDVECIYFDTSTGIKVSTYLSDLLTFNQYTHKDRIKRTALLMRKLHDKNTCIGEAFDPIARYETYAKRVKNPMLSSSEAMGIIEGIAHLNAHKTLCHNDWVEGNICFTSTKDYLIDYEYAGDNDPFFDVTSFLTENKLSLSERKEFVKAYLGHKPNLEVIDIIERYARFHNLLWCTWGMMMYESRNEAIFKNIAHDKWNALHHRVLS